MEERHYIMQEDSSCAHSWVLQLEDQLGATQAVHASLLTRHCGREKRMLGGKSVPVAAALLTLVDFACPDAQDLVSYSSMASQHYSSSRVLFT